MLFKTLRSRQRIWDDLEEEIREQPGCGMSLRWIKEWVDARLRSSVSLRTLNRCVREMGSMIISTPVLARYKMGDLIRAFRPPYFRCIGCDKWWTPLRYAWDEFRTWNLDRL